MEKIIFRKEVLEYFDELFFVLFEQEYFSFEGNARKYIDKIAQFIYEDIATFPHKSSPKELNILVQNTFFIKPIQEHFGIYFSKTKMKNI